MIFRNDLTEAIYAQMTLTRRVMPIERRRGYREILADKLREHWADLGKEGLLLVDWGGLADCILREARTKENAA